MAVLTPSFIITSDFMAILQFFNVWHLSGVLNLGIRSGFKALNT